MGHDLFKQDHSTFLYPIILSFVSWPILYFLFPKNKTKQQQQKLMELASDVWI